MLTTTFFPSSLLPSLLPSFPPPPLPPSPLLLFPSPSLLPPSLSSSLPPYFPLFLPPSLSPSLPPPSLSSILSGPTINNFLALYHCLSDREYFVCLLCNDRQSSVLLVRELVCPCPCVQACMFVCMQVLFTCYCVIQESMCVLVCPELSCHFLFLIPSPAYCFSLLM